MKFKKYVLICTVLMCSIFCSAQEGIVMTKDGQLLKGTIKIDDVLQSKEHRKKYDLFIKTKIDDKKEKNYFFAKDIKYAIINPCKKDSVFYKPLYSDDFDGKPFLCQLFCSKGNIGLYYRDYTDYSSNDGESVRDYVLATNDSVIQIAPPPVKNFFKMTKAQRQKILYTKFLSVAPTYKSMILSFINNRYNQHFQEKDFKNKEAMFDYILDKENERENETNKTSN